MTDHIAMLFRNQNTRYQPPRLNEGRGRSRSLLLLFCEVKE